MTTVAITLNDEHEQFIREAVDAGSFTSKSEVVATALEILKAREDSRRAKRLELKREIEKGIADFENGRTVEFNLDAFLADVKSKRAARG